MTALPSPTKKTSSALLFALFLVPLLVVSAIALIVSNRLAVDGYVTDDAFISFRYSRNLADGIGPVWQSGSRVEGYTNFGWVLLIGLTTKFGADPIDASRALGLLASLGTMALVPVAAAQLRPLWSRDWWIVAAGTAIALLVNTAFSLWTFAGLETPLFACLVLAAITAHWHEERTEAQWPWLSAVALLLAALTRPDGVVVFGVVALWKFISAVQRRELHTGFVLWLAYFGAPFLVYWCWRWSYYGDFFPNTYYLKSGAGLEFYERGARYVRDFVLVYWVWLALLGFASVLQEVRTRYRPVSCALTLLAVWCVYVVAGGGDWMPFFRFLVPILPIAYLVAMNGAITVTELLGRRISPAISTGVSVALAGLIVLTSLAGAGSARAKDPFGFQIDPLPGAVDVDSQGDIGLWMRQNIPAEYTVAQIATGIVPYYSELPTLDMLGVNDSHIARLDVPVGQGPAGHDKEDGAYVLMSKPEVIWLSIGLEAAPRLTPDDYRPPIDKRLAPVVTSVSHNAYLWAFYRPVAIRVNEGWLNLLVRSDVTTPALVQQSR